MSRTIKMKDQTGRLVTLNAFPQRIISLVPSITEFLFDIGLDDELIGLTKFCVHPEEKVKSKTKTGGTKNPHLERIKDLEPDLIIANKEENVKHHIEGLKQDFPVYVSDVNNLDEAYQMMKDIGSLTGKAKESEKLIRNMALEFERLKPPEDNAPQVAYLIWKNPYMVAGGDTFIHEMIQKAGYKNTFSDRKRYPVIDLNELKNHAPDLIFLSSEPYPFKEKHREEFQNNFPHSKVYTVDGELFSWYGSRLLRAPGYFEGLKSKIFG